MDVVRRVVDALDRRDFEALDELNHPDVEMDWTRSRGLDARVHRGHEAVTRFLRDLADAFHGFEVEADEFIEAGDSVVVPNTGRLRGRDGVETVARSTLVFGLRDGRVARICLYQEKAEALETVRLARS
ncbi:MAG: nuclear transport factor 2 family protein [Thermoleophilaceae bacterium]